MMITATIELPKDKDGITINVGDTVYVDSQEYKVQSLILIKADGAYKWRVCVKESCVLFAAYDISHECPDSLERIASDMGADIVSMPVGFTSDDASDLLRKYRDRIKVLAERDGDGDD